MTNSRWPSTTPCLRFALGRVSGRLLGGREAQLRPTLCLLSVGRPVGFGGFCILILLIMIIGSVLDIIHH